jgi:hypothetical protein
VTLSLYSANEEPVRIQYKCLVPIYIFPEMKLLFPKKKHNVLSLSSYTHISVRDLYISRIGLPILLCTDPWEYINVSHRHMYVEIGTEAAHNSPEKEYKNGIFVAVYGRHTPLTKTVRKQKRNCFQLSIACFPKLQKNDKIQ